MKIGSFGCRPGPRAFTLVEVVIALAVCVFALISILGLFSVGLGVESDSREQVQASNLATLLVSERRACPTNSLTNAVLPPLNQPYPATADTAFIDYAGNSTNAAGAAFDLSYQVGTNSTSPGVAFIYLRFTWPPQADPAKVQGEYELATQVLMPQ